MTSQITWKVEPGLDLSSRMIEVAGVKFSALLEKCSQYLLKRRSEDSIRTNLRLGISFLQSLSIQEVRGSNYCNSNLD